MVEIKFKFWGSLSILFVLAFFLVNTKIMAHPMPNSMITLTILEDKIVGKAQIPLRDLQSVLGQEIALAQLKTYFLAHIRPTDVNGKKWQVTIVKAKMNTTTDVISGDYQELEIDFQMLPPEVQHLHQFIFDYDVVCHQVVTHKVFVLVKQANKQIAQTIELDIPTEKIKPISIDMGKDDVGERFTKIKIASCFLVLSMSVIALHSYFKRLKLSTKTSIKSHLCDHSGEPL